MSLTAKDIHEAICTRDSTVIQRMSDAFGPMAAGSVSHAVFFPRQEVKGDSAESAFIRFPLDWNAGFSAEDRAQRLAAASATRAHGVSKLGYMAYASGNFGFPGSYDTVMNDLRSFIDSTVRAVWCTSML